MSESTVVSLEGYHLSLSNLAKVFYPDSGYTKGQVIEYYTQISNAILPHMANRPMTLKRYPNGVNGKFFYQKNCPDSRPKWLNTIPVWSDSNQAYTRYCMLANLPALVWACNMATIEFHSSLSIQGQPDTPTVLVFDLDPGFPATIILCTQVALWLKEMLNQFGLSSFVKTSGSKGLQVYVPLNTPCTYDNTKAFAHSIALMLEKRYPDTVISNMRKVLRKGKIFIDWSQNDSHKTTVCVYSLRAKESPTVSTPITWEEVFYAWHKKQEQLLTFTADTVLKRYQDLGDIFQPVLTLKQTLPVKH